VGVGYARRGVCTCVTLYSNFKPCMEMANPAMGGLTLSWPYAMKAYGISTYVQCSFNGHVDMPQLSKV